MPVFRRKSFTERVEGRRKFLVWAGLFAIVFLAFQIVSGLFLAAYTISSTTMAPSLLPGERLLVSPLPFGPLTAFGKAPAIVRPARGDLVIVHPPFAGKPGFFRSLAESLVRFVSLQLASLDPRGGDPAIEGPFLARVIALPGDEVSMENFEFKVRPPDATQALTEFEFSTRRYDIHKPALPEGWNANFPLSGVMRSFVLGKDEYFVAMDDRGASADSRTWGPIGISSFDGKVLLRYWPFAAFGNP